MLALRPTALHASFLPPGLGAPRATARSSSEIPHCGTRHDGLLSLLAIALRCTDPDWWHRVTHVQAMLALRRGPVADAFGRERRARDGRKSECRECERVGRDARSDLGAVAHRGL